MLKQIIKIYTASNGTVYTEYKENGSYQRIKDLEETRLDFRYLPLENANKIINSAKRGGIPLDKLRSIIDDETLIEDVKLGGRIVGILNIDKNPRLKWSSEITGIQSLEDIDYNMSSINLNS